jgi:hypothetical protein
MKTRACRVATFAQLSPPLDKIRSKSKAIILPVRVTFNKKLFSGLSTIPLLPTL